jgi:hypothetical protein
MHLEMALPQNIPTLEACNTCNWTCPDNVWGCTNNPSPFISCDINLSLCPTCTDNLPIVSIIDLAYMPSNQPKRFNYKTIDWREYMSKLEINLSRNDVLTLNPITTTDKLEHATDMIFEAIDKTTREVASKLKRSPHMKRWWMKELTHPHIDRNRTSTTHFRWRGLPDHPCHKEYRVINASFTRTTKKAKTNHWKEWIEHITGDNLWAIHRHMKANLANYGQQRIPNIKSPDSSTATTNQSKAKKLAETFFSPE